MGVFFREISGSGKRSYDTVRRFSDESYYGGLQLSEADERHAGPRVRRSAAAADGTEVNKTYIIDIRKYHFCIGNP